MSIDTRPGTRPLTGAPAPSWGEVVPPGETVTVLRVVLVDRVITYPFSELRRWEHVLGMRETLALTIGRDVVVVEGRELAEIRAALDLGQLAELRANFPVKSGARPGPQVRRIAIEADEWSGAAAQARAAGLSGS
jgi:hypothetical protein